jgi:heme a synthase
MTIEKSANPRQLAIWLFVCSALVFSMVVLGGVTRLTRSGLSMVNWSPIMGVVPPLSKKSWQKTFDQYKKFPEYKKINKGMSLDEFKSIYWFEFNHRLLGRLISLAFFIPFLYFLVRRIIPPGHIPKLILMPILGGLQGLLGWYMVKSGLVDEPSVSPYRLTAHLVLAFITYVYIFWVALSYWYQDRASVAPANKRYRLFAWVLTLLISVMIISGGFVAGTRAGFVFNTFPLMNGNLLPPGYLAMKPMLINFFENVATVQFNHRWLGLIVATTIAVFWFSVRAKLQERNTAIAVHLLLAMVIVQITLGITTLLLNVPVALAASHQGGALLLLTIMLYINHRLQLARD